MTKTKRRLLYLLIFVFLLGAGFFSYRTFLQNPPTARLWPSQPLTSTINPVLKIAVMSDIHSDLVHLKQALAKVKERNLSKIIIIGDLTTVGTREELTAVKKVLDASGLTYYSVPGNHDYWFINKSRIDVYGEVFGQHYQSFKEGGNKFILMDNGGDTVGEDQMAWVKSELVECKVVACLVFAHKPLNHPNSDYTLDKDSPEESKELTALFTSNGVKEIFAGHLHTSYHYELNGLTTTLDGAVTSDRNWQTPRFLEIDLSSTGDVVKREEVTLD